MLVQKGPNGGISVKRSFSKLDKDSDELDEASWPATQPAKPAMSTAKSSAHWAAKSASAFMSKAQASHKPQATTGIDKKRDFPWDAMVPPAKKTKSNDKGAFHSLTTPSVSNASASSSRSMTSNALNIRQKVALSHEQQQILQMVVEGGKNVFFTGSAGEPSPC
jgi:hypothetical protein